VTRRRPAAPALLLGPLLVLSLATTGCGGSQEDRYCTALKGDRVEFAAMVGDGSPTALVTHLAMLEELAGKAPDDLGDEWQAFLTPIRGLRDVLHDAGVAPSDYHDGTPPAGLSAAQRTAISQAADHLASDSTVSAATGIDQQARDVCKVNLGM
jgi:hypothetical protein